MSKTKWKPTILPKERLRELAMAMYGRNASNDEMAAAIKFLIAVCHEQREFSVRLGIQRAQFRISNADDPDLADLMEPAGNPRRARELVKGSELERGRFTLASNFPKTHGNHD